MANKTASQAFNRRQTLDEARRLASQNKLPAAIEAFERVVQHDPNDWNSANTLGDLLVRAQLIDRAVAHFVKIAEHRVETGFVAQAIGVYKKILRIAPGNAEALRRSEALQSQRLADTDDGGLSRRIFKAAHAKSGSAPSDEPDHETDTALTPRVGLPPDEVETQADVSPPASASVAPADHGHEYGYIQVEPSEPVSAEPTPAVIEQTHTPVLELEVDVPPAGEAAHADPSIEGRGSASDVERADLFERTTEDDVLDLTAELELSEATPDDAQPWAPAGDAGIAAAEPTAAPEAQSLGRHDRPDGAGGPGGPDAHGWPDADHELASRHEHAEQREHHPGQPEDEEGYDLTAELDVKVIGVDVEDAVSALHASDRAVPETQLEQLEARQDGDEYDPTQVLSEDDDTDAAVVSGPSDQPDHPEPVATSGDASSSDASGDTVDASQMFALVRAELLAYLSSEAAAEAAPAQDGPEDSDDPEDDDRLGDLISIEAAFLDLDSVGEDDCGADAAHLAWQSRWLEAAAMAAESSLERGMRLAEDGRWRDACAHFIEAALTPHLRHEAARCAAHARLNDGAPAEAVEWLEWAAQVPAPSKMSARALGYEVAVALEAAGQPELSLSVLQELRAEVGAGYQDVDARIARLLPDASSSLQS